MSSLMRFADKFFTRRNTDVQARTDNTPTHHGTDVQPDAGQDSFDLNLQRSDELLKYQLAENDIRRRGIALAYEYPRVLRDAVKYIEQHMPGMVETRKVITWDLHRLGSLEYLDDPSNFNRVELDLRVLRVPGRPMLYIDMDRGILYDEDPPTARVDDPAYFDRTSGYWLTPNAAYTQEMKILEKNGRALDDPTMYTNRQGVTLYDPKKRFASLGYLDEALRNCEDIYFTKSDKRNRNREPKHVLSNDANRRENTLDNVRSTETTRPRHTKPRTHSEVVGSRNTSQQIR